MVATPTTLDRMTLKDSEPSKTVSLTTARVMVWLVTPGAKVRVPDRALVPARTSPGTLAVPEVEA